MKPKLSATLAASMAGIAASCPAERLGPDSRYVVIADLRMGDGGREDELLGAKRALVDVLGGWYLDRGYTLVIAGDAEDLRGFWLKDVLAAWPELYAVFDAFADSGRLRKIVGDRDLALTLIRSYPYELLHGLRLDGAGGSLLVIHGHQASRPYVERDYLKEYLLQWQCSAIRRRSEERKGGGGEERFRSERRLYRASRSLGLTTIQGHTRRPLFESRTGRESLRFEVERLLREGDTRTSRPKLDELFETYRRAKRDDRGKRPSGDGYEGRGPVSPCLFSPGALVGKGEGRRRDMRMLEVEGGQLHLVRWAAALRPGTFERGNKAYLRRVSRSASVESVVDRVELLAGRREAAEEGWGR